jgi:hypothetical protein
MPGIASQVVGLALCSFMARHGYMELKRRRTAVRVRRSQILIVDECLGFLVML